MRGLLSLAARAAISAALFYFAVRGLNTDFVAARLQELKFAWLLAALGLAVIQLALLAARWRLIAGACDAPLAFGRAFRFSLIATFFNQVLPSTVGGDAMRIWLFTRDGAGWSKATHSVLLDRFVGVLALAIMVVACLPWTLQLIQNPVGHMALLVIGLGSIGAAAVFLALGYLRGNWLQSWMPTRHLQQMALTARRFLFSLPVGGPIMVLSQAVHTLTAGIAWCVAQAVDAPFSFFHAIELVPPVIMIATIPISIAGWGVREKSLMLAFAYAGLSGSDGFLVSVLLGVTFFAVGVVGSIVWLAGTERTKPDEIAREA